jgi:5,10-methylenetetrahydromethanopterin reductase
VIAIVGASPSLIERALGFLERGLTRAGRNRAEIELWLGMFAEITADPVCAARAAKPWAGWSFEIGDPTALTAVGIDAGQGAAAAAVYPDLVHAEPDWEAGVQAVDAVISDEAALAYAEQFCLVGEPEACARKLQLAEAAGADGFYLMHRHVYEPPVKLIDDVREELIPALVKTGSSPKH